MVTLVTQLFTTGRGLVHEHLEHCLEHKTLFSMMGADWEVVHVYQPGTESYGWALETQVNNDYADLLEDAELFCRGKEARRNGLAAHGIRSK